jgi:hypothetical protein
MTDIGRTIQALEGLNMAACGRIGLPIADSQLENPRGVGKGRLLTRFCR